MKSPVPQKKTNKVELLSFGDAIKAILEKKKVTRAEWDTNDEYCFLSSDGFLSIHIGGKDHRLLVSDGDMLANDWIVLPI